MTATRLSDVVELTNAAVETARWNPKIGCLIDRCFPGQPMFISFAFADWHHLPAFAFFASLKRLEGSIDVPHNRLLIRDTVNAWYHRGIPGLGAHVDEVAATLRGLIGSIRPSRVITVGQGMGGYGAIMFGMLLNADQIVAFVTLSHLKASEAACHGDRRFLAVMEELEADPPRSVYDDLLQLGAAVDFRGELHLVFGTHPGRDDGISGNLDAMHALRLSRLHNVHLHPYPDSNRAVVQWLTEHRQLDDLFVRLLRTDRHWNDSRAVTFACRAS